MKFCECGCGQQTTKARQTQTSEDIKKGEYRRFVNGHSTFRNHTGKTYGRLTVSHRAPNGLRGETRWACVCSCGAKVTTRATQMVSGRTKSCGCLRNEKTIERRTVHGLRHHPLYSVWKDMRRRCHNTSRSDYIHYGGRGVKVCDKWDSNFLPFYGWAMKKGYAPGLTLDRRNNNGGYSPRNCRFITRAEQSRNRRESKHWKRRESTCLF